MKHKFGVGPEGACGWVSKCGVSGEARSSETRSAHANEAFATSYSPRTSFAIHSASRPPNKRYNDLKPTAIQILRRVVATRLAENQSNGWAFGLDLGHAGPGHNILANCTYSFLNSFPGKH